MYRSPPTPTQREDPLGTFIEIVIAILVLCCVIGLFASGGPGNSEPPTPEEDEDDEIAEWEGGRW